jgi:hypothetical protein
MKYRIQVFLTETQASYLKEISEKTGESVANIIRRAIEIFKRNAR